MSIKITLIILLFTITAVAQESNITLQQQQDTTANTHINYRRTSDNQPAYRTGRLPTSYYQQPKEQVFPLGWNKGTLGKVTGGTGVWTELNPKVPRVDYLGIGFVNKDTGWAVGSNGALIKTTDGGVSWVTINTPTTSPILKVRSYNGQVVIASGFDGLILRSTDGGETFSLVASGVGSGYDLWGLEMVNDTIGWACGATALLKTTNAGASWQIINTPGYTGNLWWIEFLNEDYGFVAADGKVLRTTDGGNNWEIIQAGDNKSLYSIDVIDSLHIAAAGYGGTDYPAKNVYSSDGGYTWINGGFLTTEAVNDIKYINRDTGYVIMNNIIGWKTTNRGQQWTGMSIGGEWEMQLFVEDSIGYSAGTELRIYKTENGYENWQRLIINDNFSDVFFVNEQKGFALSGSLYKTTDSGINWQRVSGAPGGSDILFLDSLTGFIGSNIIYKTMDGGENWYATQGSGGAGKIFFINSTVGWAERSNKIYKTTDSGENWFTQLTLPSDHFTSIFFVDSLNGWATSRYVWQTTDGGENWIERTDIPILFPDDIYFTDIDTGFVIELLDLYKTTDSGNNWSTQLHSDYIIRHFGWLSKNHGFIVGDGMYETTDKGGSWDEILGLRNVGLRKFQAPTEFLGYSVGHTGLIYKYLDTSYVPVELTSFGGYLTENKIILEWETASELNNQGFYIEKSYDKINWQTIGFVDGNGTTTEKHYYNFVDPKPLIGKINYRLKQLDYDGTFKYSKSITIFYKNTHLTFELFQNYPNPFNPTTTIKYSIKNAGLVTLKVYDILGKEVATLVNENKTAGNYSVNFNASNLPSGIYFYRLKSGSFSATKKLILLK